MKGTEKIKLLGIGFSSASEDEILEYIFSRSFTYDKKTVVVTPNPELVMIALNNPQYKKVLNQAQVSLPDGVGVVWAFELLGKGHLKRISGVDFMQKLCMECANRRISVGFVGGYENVAEKTSECLRKSYKNLNVVYAGGDEEKFLRTRKQVDVLFVALGSPKQEMWIADNLDRLPVKVVMGVGGAFDMISGRVRRAPRWIRKLGLEWLWRLVRQPWRVKRQIRLVQFVIEVVKVRIRNN